MTIPLNPSVSVASAATSKNLAPQGNSSLIKVTHASADHVEAILELIEPFVQAQLLLRRDREEILRLTRRGFVANDGNKVIGFASVEVYSKKLAEIHCLAVAEGYQKQGIGKLLVNKCIQLARDEDILELMAISASDEFLKQCGFDYSLPNQKRALFYRFED
jgi:amino-acid N-acetyltransferase